jgi:phosphatidate cytidylyltransferase
MNSNYSTLGKRVLVSVFGIPVVLGSMYYGRIALPLLASVIEIMALWELYKIAEKKGFFPVSWPAFAMILALNADLYFRQARDCFWILCGFFLISLLLELFHNKPNTTANISVTVFGAFYVSLFSFFILIREMPRFSGSRYSVGGWMVLLVFITMWVCDTAAYFVGSSFGRTKLFPRVSPKKTWEGAVAGFITAVILSLIIRKFALPEIGTADAIFIGTIVGIIGQTSDLVESLFKRDAGVKDSSSLLPGHGGMLDRFDSPLLVGPIVYAYLVLSQVH